MRRRPSRPHDSVGMRSVSRQPIAICAAAALGLVALGSLVLLHPGVAGAGGDDSAAVRGYIVPTPNNPDVDPATTCAGTFADNDQFDDQPQSPAGTASNAVTLAGCSYDATPFGGPSTEDRPVVFEVTSGPGGLLCGAGVQQSQVCALPGINHGAGLEYRVLANNEIGVNATGSLRVEFCADDPPVQGVCGLEDEQATQFTINWRRGGGGGGGAGGRCAGRPVTIQASGPRTPGTPDDDVIAGRKGKDRISGKGGDDLICAKGGNDRVKGGGGKDRLLGQGGGDKVAGGGGKDNLKGGGGNDRLNGGGGKDRCNGGPGKDRLRRCEKGSA